MPVGHELGLVDDETWERFCARRAACEGLRQKLSASRVRPEDAAEWLLGRNDPPLAQTVPGIELARRPEAKLSEVCAVAGLSAEQAALGRAGTLFLQSDIAYEGFKAREARDLERVRRLSGALLPRDIDWLHAEGISIEAREALQRERPLTVGQAARLPGVRPADVAVLQLHLASH